MKHENAQRLFPLWRFRASGVLYPMDKRAHRTEQAAHRLIKSQARMYVYKAKSKLTDGAVYKKMLMLETAIEEDATREWEAALALWPPGVDRLALHPFIEEAVRRACEECRPFGEDLGLEAVCALSTFFFSEFEPKVMVS